MILSRFLPHPLRNVPRPFETWHCVTRPSHCCICPCNRKGMALFVRVSENQCVLVCVSESEETERPRRWSANLLFFLPSFRCFIQEDSFINSCCSDNRLRITCVFYLVGGNACGAKRTGKGRGGEVEGRGGEGGGEEREGVGKRGKMCVALMRVNCKQ